MVEHVKKSFFDHYSEGRPTGFGNRLMTSMSSLVFQFAEVEQGMIVMEIGPGRGQFADVCLENGVEYWAIEPNNQMADALQNRGARVIRCVVPPMPEIEQRFDIVVMNNVMEHLDSMTSALTLSRQVCELLNPGGRFVISSPDYANWGKYFFLVDFTHNYVTSYRRIEQLLNNAGFMNIQARYHSGPFVGPIALLLSCLAGWLPFGRLQILFPRNRLYRKLFKLQTPFLRRVLAGGQKPA